jgi:hypothetical protein
MTPAVTVDRLVQEVWRAAQSEEEADWRTLLKSPGVTFCLDASAVAQTPEQALSSAEREIGRARQSSIAAGVAKRALVQGFLIRDDARRGFAEALFSEATNYLVSRDLAGYVGEHFRNRRVSDAIEFKESIRSHVRQEVSMLIEEEGLPQIGDLEGWEGFIDAAVTRLSS